MFKNNRDILQILRSSGIPTYYAQPPDNTLEPYLIYMQVGDANFIADDSVYMPANRYVLELYTAQKDFALEKALEDALTAGGLVWAKGADSPINEPTKIYMVPYYI